MVIKLRQCSPLLSRSYVSFARPKGRVHAVTMAALNHSKILHTFQKESASKLQSPAHEHFPKHELAKRYHYIRPRVQATVASATVFTIAGLGHVLEDEKKKKDPVNKRTEWIIIATNALVLGCWRIKGLQRFMNTYFTHRVESGRLITLVTSCFSHRYFLHFIPNMTLLYYFLGPVQELSSRYEIVAVYLSSGIFGFAASHVIRLARYNTYSQTLLPSMGSSGGFAGIMAVAYSWLDWDTHLAKIGVSRDVFVMQVSSDLAGLILGMKVIDFVAHLGGAMFGYLYAAYGRDYIWHPLVSTLRKLLY